MGVSALAANSSGGNNVAIGYQAGLANSTGGQSTLIGSQAGLAGTDLDYVTAVGYQALSSVTSGDFNTALGAQALKANTSAANNTAIGYLAGGAITTGGQNLFVGQEAGYSTNASTVGARNHILGAFSRCSSASGNDQIVIGYNITGKGDNTAFISANSGNTYNGANTTTWATTSDQRLKKNIADNTIGLEKITALRVRNFEYRTENEITELPTNTAIQKTGVQLGVIAQEIQQILPDCVTEESTGVLSVQTDNLIWYLVNAVKELSARIKQLEGN
jgi:hypothetical protein